LAGTSQNAIKSGFFVISGRNSGETEGEFHYYLKKQSQLIVVQRSAFCGKMRKRCLKKQSQTPAFGRKSEARSSKSEITAFIRTPI
jgi:hypothetical protein